MNTQYDQFGRPIWSEPELYDDPSPNAFSLAALVCGILAILSICVGGAIIPAALGILFALLSRKTRMCGQAKVGFFLSIGSMVLYVLALLFLIGTLALTGILGPLTEKALNTDFTDPSSVSEFQEETYRLLDSLMERYSKFLPEEAAQNPTKEQAVIPRSEAKNLFYRVSEGEILRRCAPQDDIFSALSKSEPQKRSAGDFAESSCPKAAQNRSTEKCSLKEK